MSFIHEKCCPCILSPLDLFAAPMTQTSIEGTKTLQYRPVSSLDSANVIEFLIPSSDDYLDLSSLRLHIKLKVVKVDANGTESSLEATDKVSVENLLLHALFSQIDLTIGDKTVTPSLNTYPWRAFLETLLSFGTDPKNSFLTASGWIGTQASQTVDTQRSKLIELSREVDLMGKLHLDMSQQERFLLPHVNLKIRLVRSKDSFVLIRDSASTITPKIIIQSCVLYLNHVMVAPEVQTAHLKALELGPALYPIRRIQVRNYQLSQGNRIGLIDNITGVIPKRIVLGLITTKALNGSLNNSPFFFEHFGLERLSCFVDGTPIPIKAFEPDFENDNYARSYLALFEGTNNFYSNDGIPKISYKDYKNQALWAINLSPDQSDNLTHNNLVRHGTLRLELYFKSPLTESISVLLYMETESLISIDKNREVILDF